MLHVQSAQRHEAQVGDLLAAILQQPQTRAAALLAEQGITRLDMLEYICAWNHQDADRHDDGCAEPADGGRDGMAGSGDPGSSTAKDPLSAYCVNLTARARQGLLDPLIGRTEELQRTIEVLVPAPEEQPGVRRRCRRRQDGDGRRPRRPAALRRRAGHTEGRGDLRARHRCAARRLALPRRLRGALQGRRQGAQRAAEGRSSSSTRFMRPSARAPSPAARWISPRC